MKPRRSRSLQRILAGIVVCSQLAQADSLTWNNLLSSRNGQAGGYLLDSASAQLDPTQHAIEYPAMASVLEAMGAYADAGDSSAADRLAASVAGPGVTALNAAFRTQMARQLNEMRNRLTTLNGGMPCDPPDPKAPCPEKPRYAVWANAEIDYQNLRSDNTGPGFKLNSIGGTAGFAARTGENFTLGAAFTGMSGRLSSKSQTSQASGDLDVYYANVFARYDSGCWSHSLMGSAGFADATLNRRLYYPGGNYATHGSTDGLGLGIMYEVARTYRISEDYMASAWWQPVLNVAYIHTKMDSYTESGSDAALHVGDQEFNNVIFGFGVRMQTVVGEKYLNTPGLMEARVLGKGIAGNRRSKADVSFANGIGGASVCGSESSPMGVEIGIGFSVPLWGYGAVIADCSAEFYNHENSVNGILGYRIDF